tara:strand:- start:4760 stop:4942 length:183 start_codon:yes stop_codon:yes gene_type:complete
MTRRNLKCPTCKGTGVHHFFNPEFDEWVDRNCGECSGAGWLDGSYFNIIDFYGGEDEEQY